MHLEHKTRILAGLAFAQVEAHESSTRFGYWEKHRSIEEVVALIHRSASQLIEITVTGDGPAKNLADCTRLEEALADVVIRCMDLAEWKGLHVAPAVLSKLEYNEQLSKLVRKDF